MNIKIAKEIKFQRDAVEGFDADEQFKKELTSWIQESAKEVLEDTMKDAKKYKTLLGDVLAINVSVSIGDPEGEEDDE